MTTATLHAVEIDDEILIWDPVSESLHRLNRTAASVWRALLGGESVETIVARATGDARENARVRRDVEACRNTLETEGLTGRPVTGLR